MQLHPVRVMTLTGYCDLTNCEVAVRVGGNEMTLTGSANVVRSKEVGNYKLNKYINNFKN